MIHGPIRDYVVYDVEIAKEVGRVPGGWENPEGMGFASAVTYSYADDRYRFWLGDAAHMPLCEFLQGYRAVTFNGVKFDSRVLLGNNREMTIHGVTENGGLGWGNYDILLEYVRARFGYDNVGQAENRLGDKAIHDGSFSLDGLSEGTFGLHKTGHGANAPILYQAGKYAELLDYNLHDVRLTRKLFDFIREYGFVVDRAGRVVRL